jgi:CubicO group peptidase (beta-lactamase class C family)
MADLHDLLASYVAQGSLPGAVALLAHGDRAEVTVVGSAAVGGAPMTRDAIFRFASITKPITAAAVMMLIEDGRIALDDPVARWLPELADPKVVRTSARSPSCSPRWRTARSRRAGCGTSGGTRPGLADGPRKPG